MRVIGAGFGRTGTMSLKGALEQLGFNPCYHMFEVSRNPGHVRLWQAAADGHPVDWRAMFADYRAAVDWPVCNYYAYLMEVYPEAKVILTVRDPDRWYDSAINTIYYTNTVVPDDPERRVHFEMIKAVVWRNVFDGRFEDRDFAISVFNDHNRQVMERVPAERLLVYAVKEGWEPLCRFLDVPVPVDTPFPRLNDTASFQRNVQSRVADVSSTP